MNLHSAIQRKANVPIALNDVNASRLSEAAKNLDKCIDPVELGRYRVGF